MGHILHHAIVVTSSDSDAIKAAHDEAVRLGCETSPLIEGAVNGYLTFLIAPDGSKSGWDASDEGDGRRDQWVAWAETKRYDDDSSPLEWVEVAYGSDDRRAAVTRHEWTDSASLSTGGQKR